ncbi:MAG: UbiA family prenyltransferase, partial [Firmicutes bacterium]|nr:UbiA family prenyltransferase [Bacillota bacterium]
RNPRTAHWPTVTGEVSRRANLVLIIVSLAVLFGAASRLNPLALKLFPAAVVIVLAYSYTKRFTWACHLFLGLAQSLAPMGGWVAVTGTLETPAVLLGIAAGSWVAGFDIIYACQDVEFDRREGLHSIPARFGVAAGLRLARTLHLVTVAALVLAAPAAGLGWIYLLGVAVAAGLLVFEHSLVSPRDLSMAPVAFFKVNAVVSVTIMIAVMASLLIGID